MSDHRPLENAAYRERFRRTGALLDADDQRPHGHPKSVRGAHIALLRGVLAFAVAWTGPATWVSVGA